jgi:regulator of sigma E protease
MTFLQTLISFLVALTLLIFVHELGHYLVARWCGVKVLRFSIGFGRPVASWTVGPDRTEWTLSAIPLGGYVRMLDEREQRDAPIPPEELPRAFSRMSLPRRALIVAAGPAANFALAVVLYLILNAVGVQEAAPVVGAPERDTPAAVAGLAQGDRIQAVGGDAVRSWNDVRMRLLEGVIDHRPVPLAVERDGRRLALVLDTSTLPAGEVERDFMRSLGLELATGRIAVSSVMPDSAAARAGLKAGDEIVRVDRKPLRKGNELIEAIRVRPGQPMRFEVQRGADLLSIEVVPDAKPSDRPEDAGRVVGRIGAGITSRVEMTEVRYTGFEAVQRSVAQTWEMSSFTLRMLGKMLVGELSWRNLSGPVSIADYAGQSARVGWYAYLSFLALISVSLGVLNLLPIPVLDGGHLVYYGLEALRGRPLSERFIEITQKAGLAVIGVMMALALFNDLTRLIGS